MTTTTATATEEFLSTLRLLLHRDGIRGIGKLLAGELRGMANLIGDDGERAHGLITAAVEVERKMESIGQRYGV